MFPSCLLHFSRLLLHVLQSLVRANNIYRYRRLTQTIRRTAAVRRRWWWNDCRWRLMMMMTTRIRFGTMFRRRRFVLGTTFRWRWRRWLRRHGRHRRRLVWFAGYVFVVAGRTGWWCWARWFGWWCNGWGFNFVLTVRTTPCRIVFVCIGIGYLGTVAFLVVERLAICAFDQSILCTGFNATTHYAI